MWKAVGLAPDRGAYCMRQPRIRFEERDSARTRGLVEKAFDSAPDDSWVRYAARRVFDHHPRHRARPDSRPSRFSIPAPCNT
ncbi:hypothetical protein GCM10028833_41960 [Glycomyces tarimensis]